MGRPRTTKREARFIAQWNRACRDCDGTGWKPMMNDASRVTRCHCWKIIDRIAKTVRPAVEVKEMFDGKLAACGG